MKILKKDNYIKNYILIMASFIISILIFSACSRQERFIAEKDINLEFPKEVLSTANSSTYMTDEEIIKRANAICTGEIYVDYRFSEPYICNIEQIEWDVAFSESPGTFMLYLQALNPVSYLTKAYYLSGDIKYLDVGQSIIKQWIQYKEKRKTSNNAYLWYDQGTAIRSNNLIYFLLAYTGGGMTRNFIIN